MAFSSPGSQEAMRMLFLNQSSESNNALDVPTRGGPFAKEEGILLANSWIFSGLTDGEINKIMDSAKPCWYLSQVNCVVSYFMIQVVQQNVHYSDFMIFLSLQYYWDILIVNDDLPTEVPKIFIAPGSRQIRRSHQFHAFLGSDQGGIPQRRLWKKCSTHLEAMNQKIDVLRQD